MRKSLVLTALCSLLTMLGNAQTSACEFIPNTSFGEVYNVCITMDNAASSCSPKLIHSNGNIPSIEQTNFMEGDPLDFFVVDVNSTIQVTVTLDLTSALSDDEYPDFGNTADFYLGNYNSTADVEYNLPDIFGIGEAYATCTFNLNPGLITSNSVLSDPLKITFQNNNQFDPTPAYQVATRVIVKGFETFSNPSWITQSPLTVPQLILRNPPGDQSYSYLQTSEEICTGTSTYVAMSEGFEAWAEVKYGSAGSAGFIVETEYSAYASLSGGLEMGRNTTASEEYEMCFTSSTEYQTTPENGLIGSSGDVYIGAAIEYEYGKYTELAAGGCQTPTVTTDLMFKPTGQTNTYLYTESHIEESVIPQLQTDSATFTPGTENYITTVDQLQVWRDALELNQQLKDEATEYDTYSFSGTAVSQTTTATTQEIKSLESSVYISASLAFEVGLEANNTGTTLGAKVTTRTDMGSTTNSSNTNTNSVQWSLHDDNSTDVITVDVYKDKVFGTPIFKMDEDQSSTSCPYEGGYQIDQPHLTFADGTQELTISGIPIGEAATFEIDLCNQSTFVRDYLLRVDASTNPSGAIFSGFGGNISELDDGMLFDQIGPMACIENGIVSVEQLDENILDYEGIELYFYVDYECQPEYAPIESSITLNLHFENPDIVESGELTEEQLSVVPNPNSGHFDLWLPTLSEPTQATLLDLTGRIIEQRQLQVGENRVGFNQNQLPKGTYLLTLTQHAGRTITKKVMIQ